DLARRPVSVLLELAARRLPDVRHQRHGEPAARGSDLGRWQFRRPTVDPGYGDPRCATDAPTQPRRPPALLDHITVFVVGQPVLSRYRRRGLADDESRRLSRGGTHGA